MLAVLNSAAGTVLFVPGADGLRPPPSWCVTKITSCSYQNLSSKSLFYFDFHILSYPYSTQMHYVFQVNVKI